MPKRKRYDWEKSFGEPDNDYGFSTENENSLILSFNGAPPTLNLWANSMTPFDRRDCNKSWSLRILALVAKIRISFRLPDFHEGAVIVHYDRGYCGKPADLDNCIMKVLLDGLVNCGVLPDDSPLHVAEVRYTQTSYPTRREIRSQIIVEKLSDNQVE